MPEDMTLTGFFVAAPSRVAVGEEFSLGVKGLTKPYPVGWACYRPVPQLASTYNLSPRGIAYLDNSPRGWRGRVSLAGGSGYAGPRAFNFVDCEGAFPGDDRPIARVSGLRFEKPGVRFVTVRDRESGITAKSNPIIVTESEPKDRIYWGDLHSQTFFSDGLRCPEELYAFARDEAFLDIFAMADHAEFLTDRQWEYFVDVTNDYNQPGEFVTLVGLEWTCRRYGHRNVYYPGDGGPILRASDPVERELAHVHKVARKHGALVIPHHSANVEMGVNWELGHDPEVERLVEIHSIWGNSERPESAGNPYPIRTNHGEKAGQHVLDALAGGRRFGFIGGGDIHDGRPGDELHSLQSKPEQYCLLHRQGIMAVRAKKLTRKAIFDALWNRQCYATTNCRVYLEFDVCGRPMGSQVQVRKRRPIRVYAVSEEPIARIDIVRNGEDWHTVKPKQTEVLVEIDDTDDVGAVWYYARVTRTDGQMAWSSPVWAE